MCAAGFHLGWGDSWNQHHIQIVTSVFLKQSADNSFSGSRVTLWSGPSSGVCVSSWNEGCHLRWLCCLLLCGSQWHLSGSGVRRWTRCNSSRTRGVHNNNKLDRTNKELHKRWQDIVLQNPLLQAHALCAVWRMMGEYGANLEQKLGFNGAVWLF